MEKQKKIWHMDDWQFVTNIMWFVVGCMMCGWYVSIFLEKLFN